MSQSEPITILIVNEHAEEIKLVTISLRGFFPDVRIDVAYSAEEAARLRPPTNNEWAIVLIDEACLADAPSSFVDDLKSRASYASIILQSTRTDSAAALEALQIGADYFLYKHSAAFLTELLFCAKEAIDRRVWRFSADRAEVRHSWLADSISEVFYELDADGRFLALSRNAPAMLGYQPDELIGRPYQTLVLESEQPLARYRFNERRTGVRAVAELELTLQRKPVADRLIRITTAISARGVYDLSRRFLGTIGIIRDLSDRTQQQAAQQELRQERLRTDDLRSLVEKITGHSKGLYQPLSTLLQESQKLSETLRESRIIERLQALTEEAAASAQLGMALARLVGEGKTGATIHRLLEDAVALIEPVLEGSGGFLTECPSVLPPYEGDREPAIRFFRHLLAYASSFLAAVGRPHVIAVKTRIDRPTGLAGAPTLFPLTPSELITMEVIETGTAKPSSWHLPSPAGSVDLPELYRLAGALAATLDISAPISGPFRMTVRFARASSPLPRPDDPVALSVVAGPRSGQVRQEKPDVTGSARTDRRGHARVPTALPAKVTMGSSSWDGTVINLSVSGACVRMSGGVLSIVRQEAHIAVNTSVGILELRGQVYERAPSAGEMPDSPLIVAFDPAPQTEAAVLASLIDAARERSLLFAFEIRLAAMETIGRGTGQPLSFEAAESDRRETVRLSLSLPARLETSRRQEPADRLAAQVTNLSRSGACLLFQESREELTGSVHIHFAPAHRSESAHEPGAPDTALPANVVWSAPDPTAAGALYAQGMASAVRAGLRFTALTPYAERELNRVIRQHMRAQRTGEAWSTAAPLVSVPRECRNARGQAIAITDDHLRQLADANRAVIIIAPGYGQTASDYTALAYYLAQHHFRIFRYDPTNHLGQSEGELQHTTLRSMQHDLDKVIEYVRHTWPQAPVLLIASDLTARTALKIALQSRPPDLLVLMNPTIDVGSLLMAVHGHDLIADYQFGLRRGVCNLLGLNVNLDQFVGDVVAGRYADLQSTLDDLRLIRSPLCIATGPAASNTLPPSDLPHAFITALGAHMKLLNVSTSLTGQHLDVQGAPPAAFKQLLKEIASVIPVEPLSPQQEISAQPYVAQQHRIEQEYTFLRHDGSQINREALCAAHLSQLPHLANLHEYRKLLDDLYGLMSPLNSGALLVDAGIGQSDLTRAALVNHTYRAGQASWTGRPAPLMIGVGRSRERIGPARHAVHLLQRELATGFIGRLSAMPPLATGWIQADWTNALPFKTGSVTRLVCNLSLSYVPSPLAALREWHRVLHTEGSLIFTTFHPNTDLSPLYRRHVRQANQDEFSTQAQPLLHYFARLREAIRHGILNTFTEEGLAALLRQCGIASFRILPIFDGQAYVAIVGKQNSSGSLR